MIDILAIAFYIILIAVFSYLIIGAVLSLFYQEDVVDRYNKDKEKGLVDFPILYVFFYIIIQWPVIHWRYIHEMRQTRKRAERGELTPLEKWARESDNPLLCLDWVVAQTTAARARKEGFDVIVQRTDEVEERWAVGMRP